MYNMWGSSGGKLYGSQSRYVSEGSPCPSESISCSSMFLFALLCFTSKLMGEAELLRLDAVISMRFHIRGGLERNWMIVTHCHECMWQP
jgi:hypothetical protein